MGRTVTVSCAVSQTSVGVGRRRDRSTSGDNNGLRGVSLSLFLRSPRGLTEEMPGPAQSCKNYFSGSYLLGRHVEYRRAHVDLGVVLNARQDEEYSCGRRINSQHSAV